MLEAIKNFIINIVDGVINLVDGVAVMVEYVITLVRDIAFIVGYIGQLVYSGIGLWFSWLPGLCSTLILTCLAIAVVYKILGRE